MRQEDRKGAAQKLLDAIGQLPEDMIAEAGDIEAFQDRRKKRKRSYAVRIFGSAAVLAAAVLAVVVWRGDIITGGGGMEEKSANYFYAHDDAQMENNGVQKQKQEAADSEESAEADAVELINIWNLPIAKEEDVGSVAKSGGTQSNAEDSATQESQYSQKDSRQEERWGQKLNRGEVYSVEADIQGKGKDKCVQFTLQLGSEEEELRYRLKAARLSMEISKDSSMEIPKEISGDNSKEISGDNSLEVSESSGKADRAGQKKKSIIKCGSGTQIVCSFHPSSPAVPGKDVVGKELALPEWKEKGIRSVARIIVTVEDSSSEKSECTVVLGRAAGRYYIVMI